MLCGKCNLYQRGNTKKDEPKETIFEGQKKGLILARYSRYLFNSLHLFTYIVSTQSHFCNKDKQYSKKNYKLS